MAGPLTGIKVVDLSRVLAGPWATQVLADFGADVIKIERPNVGDETRKWGPPYLKTKNSEESQQAAYFQSANRGKRSLTLDITTDQGQEIVRQLVKQSDVLVENFKVGGLKKFGLDYQSLTRINPRLIYCSITGYGQTGPYKQKPGYDAVIQGLGGLMSVTGIPDELPGGGPQKVGVAVTDLMTGMYAVSAITAALYNREKTGKGQSIDLALLDTQVAYLANQSMNYLVGNEIPQRHGTAHPNIVPYQAVKAKDGHFMLAVGNNQQFERFCMAIGLAELAKDAKYSSNSQRVLNRNTLISSIESVLVNNKCSYWIDKLSEVNVPSSPINNIAQVFDDPQVKSRQLLLELDNSTFGKVKSVANPVRFSDTTIEYNLSPPALGSDNQEVLQSLGFDDKMIKQLVDDSII